jgi:hypothetical protein
MRFLKDLLSESSRASMMRFMSLVCCLAAISIAILGINKPTIDYSGLSLLCGAFLSAAFGGKIMQKSIEAKGVKVTESTDSVN